MTRSERIAQTIVRRTRREVRAMSEAKLRRLAVLALLVSGASASPVPKGQSITHVPVDLIEAIRQEIA